MSVFVTNGLPTLLDALVNGLSVWVHLYRTDTPLSRDTTLADLSELDVPGYAPKPAANWAPSTLVEGVAQTEADPILFTRSAGTPSRDVFGYYATNGRTGPLLWAERVPAAPFPMHDAADELEVIPRVELGPCPPGPPRLSIDAAGDVLVTVRESRRLVIDGAGDVVVTVAPPPLDVLIDGAGDLIPTISLDLGTREIDGAGDVVVTIVPPPPPPGIDGVGDVVVTITLDLGTREMDGAGDVVVS